jgi:hypothetical protein
LVLFLKFHKNNWGYLNINKPIIPAMQEIKKALLWDLDNTVKKSPFIGLHKIPSRPKPLILDLKPQEALARINPQIARYRLTPLSKMKIYLANIGGLNEKILFAINLACDYAHYNRLQQFINTGRENQIDWVNSTKTKIKDLGLAEIIHDSLFCPSSLRHDHASGKMIGIYELLLNQGCSKILHIDDCLKTAVGMARICQNAGITRDQVSIAFLGNPSPKITQNYPNLIYTPDPRDAIEALTE